MALMATGRGRTIMAAILKVLGLQQRQKMQRRSEKGTAKL